MSAQMGVPVLSSRLSAATPAYPFIVQSLRELDLGAVEASLRETGVNAMRGGGIVRPRTVEHILSSIPLNWKPGTIVYLTPDDTPARHYEPIFERAKPRLSLSGRPIKSSEEAAT